MFKSFQTSITPKREFSRASKMPENVYYLDVRIHHRICDDRKHLLHTLVKLKVKTIDNCTINLRIPKNN